MYTIRYDEDALREIGELRPFDQARVFDEIDARLRTGPTTPSRGRKRLDGLLPPWDTVGAVWQLRVGEFRVFYDVDDAAREVNIRAVRRKGTKRTEDIV